MPPADVPVGFPPPRSNETDPVNPGLRPAAGPPPDSLLEITTEYPSASAAFTEDSMDDE